MPCSSLLNKWYISTITLTTSKSRQYQATSASLTWKALLQLDSLMHRQRYAAQYVAACQIVSHKSSACCKMPTQGGVVQR